MDDSLTRVYIMIKDPKRPILDCAVEIAVTFLSEELGVPFHIGDRTVSIAMPERAGDTGWFAANVLKYEDMVGAASDAAVRRRADRMRELFEEAGGDPYRLGWAVLEERLRVWCVPFDLWRMGE